MAPTPEPTRADLAAAWTEGEVYAALTNARNILTSITFDLSRLGDSTTAAEIDSIVNRLGVIRRERQAAWKQGRV